jgi:hypothetical protein
MRHGCALALALLAACKGSSGHKAEPDPGARGVKLKFSNDFELLRSEVAAAFPDQADGFDALTRAVREFNELDLDAPTLNAREIVEAHISNPVLVDMIFCPLCSTAPRARTTWTGTSSSSCSRASSSKGSQDHKPVCGTC